MGYFLSRFVDTCPKDWILGALSALKTSEMGSPTTNCDPYDHRLAPCHYIPLPYYIGIPKDYCYPTGTLSGFKHPRKEGKSMDMLWNGLSTFFMLLHPTPPDCMALRCWKHSPWLIAKVSACLSLDIEGGSQLQCHGCFPTVCTVQSLQSVDSCSILCYLRGQIGRKKDCLL